MLDDRLYDEVLLLKQLQVTFTLLALITNKLHLLFQRRRKGVTLLAALGRLTSLA